MNYYLADAGGKQRGPFPADQLLAQGLRPDSLVWAEGMAQWIRADAAPELRGLFSAPPPMPQQTFPAQGYPQYVSTPAYTSDNRKVAAGICGIMLGAFGVHKFILGMTGTGILMLLISCTCVGYFVMHTIGFVEGIIYLSKSDEEFYQTYIVGKKTWF